MISDCWSYRTDTPDVGDGETLEGVTPSCPHVREAYKVENAKSDDAQSTLE